MNLLEGDREGGLPVGKKLKFSQIIPRQVISS